MFDKLEDNGMYKHYWGILKSNSGCMKYIQEDNPYDLDAELETFVEFLQKVTPETEIGNLTDMNWDRIMSIYFTDFISPNIKLSQPIDITRWRYFI